MDAANRFKRQKFYVGFRDLANHPWEGVDGAAVAADSGVVCPPTRERPEGLAVTSCCCFFQNHRINSFFRYVHLYKALLGFTQGLHPGNQFHQTPHSHPSPSPSPRATARSLCSSSSHISCLARTTNTCSPASPPHWLFSAPSWASAPASPQTPLVRVAKSLQVPKSKCGFSILVVAHFSAISDRSLCGRETAALPKASHPNNEDVFRVLPSPLTETTNHCDSLPTGVCPPCQPQSSQGRLCKNIRMSLTS